MTKDGLADESGRKPDGLSDGNGPQQVHITRLVLTEFRNYSTLSLALSPGAVVLTGENGAGKTNLLEAVSFLTPGRGLRRAAYETVAREAAAAGFAVHADIEGAFGACEIGTGTAGHSGKGDNGRRVRINGANAKSADAMLEWLRVMWITPAMDSLFTGRAVDRRRFLDRLVLSIDPAHGRRALDYERAMRSRNRLLVEDMRDDAWFDAIETQMAETGVAIAAARVEMVRLLTAMVERLPANGAFPKALVALDGTLEAAVGAHAAVDAEENFRGALRAGRGRDRAAGRTLEGPHRTELNVRHEPKDMAAANCSTGEQKALLVGIVLAHARLTGELSGAAPILLLDEIAAHLDAARRAALFSILDELNCQAFMTGTEAPLFESIRDRAQFLTVAAGEITPTRFD